MPILHYKAYWCTLRALLCLVVALMPALSPTLLPTLSLRAQDDDAPPATVVNDEGGPVAITGEVTYTNPLFTVGTAAPMVILEDQAGFIDRNEGFILPVASQTLGQITSDFFASPFSYSIALPIEPQGSLRDVDQDGVTEQGVMVFAVAYWTNIFGDPFLEERDLFGGGWSTAYASTRVSSDVDTRREIVGGTFLVYAPDDEQGFPAGFGEDGLLFTDDDPVVTLPQGYTTVHMDAQPFTFDRTRRPVIDLIEPETAALDDFSGLSYSAAFDAMIEKLRKEYAFTEYKGIDWDAMSDAFRPRFVEAEENNDALAYRRALRDFSFAIPDGHVSGPFLVDDFRVATGGGLGMAIRELDDGRVIVNYLLEGGPAETADIELRAEILAFDDVPIGEAVSNTLAWSAPFSTEHFKRLQQLRYVTRSPVDTQQRVTFRNPSGATARTVTLTSVPERDSFSFSSFARGLTGFELPVEYRLLDNGYGYVKINSFSDNELLTVQLWERLMRTLNENNVSGLIIDMRQNSGGSGFLADQMAAYFYEVEHELGNAGFYDEKLDGFYFDPRTIDRYYLPVADLRYDGKIAVLVGPNCNSACEFFSYDLTVGDRAAIVGQYPTAGLGGSIDIFLMPENERFQFTRGRAVDVNGEIHIEGKGVEPTVRVPVNEETLFSEGDPVLDAAVAFLDGETTLSFIDAGVLAVGESVTNIIFQGKRVRYTLDVHKDEVINIYLEGKTGPLDTVLRIYGPDGALLIENDNAHEETVSSAFEELSIPLDLSLIVEAATVNDAEVGAFGLRVLAADGANQVGTDGAEGENANEQDRADVDAAGTSTEAPVQNVIDAPTVADPTALSGAEDAPNDAQSGAAGAGENDTDASQDDENASALAVIGTALIQTEGARLRVRGSPETTADIVGYVANRSRHQVLGFSEDGKWVHIVITDAQDADNLGIGESGWVAVEFVRIRIGD